MSQAPGGCNRAGAVVGASTVSGELLAGQSGGGITRTPSLASMRDDGRSHSTLPGGTLAALDWDQLAQRVNEVHRAVEAHSMDKAKRAVPLVMNARYHAAAVGVALELITNAEDPDRGRALGELFTGPQDLLDWTAFSLGARSAMSALDLCAAAAWRLSDGEPPMGDWEQDLYHAFRDRAQFLSGPLREWIVRAYKSAEYPQIRAFRHGFTHRLVRRHAKVILGEGRAEYESEVTDFRQTTAIAHLQMAAPFAVEQFSAFCDAVVEQFKH